jgi:cell division septum initiation protein DivIVA
MTTQPLRRADELLSELAELVETARAVPMSGSCVVPREHVLDLLDELRDVMPPEMEEARRTLSQRDALLAEAAEVRRQAHEHAGAEAAAIVAEARARADQLLSDAEVRAYETVEAGKAEHAELVSASRVHQSATEDAARLRADADAFADHTLADLIAVLRRATDTAEQGRHQLAARREGRPADEDPAISE